MRGEWGGGAGVRVVVEVRLQGGAGAIVGKELRYTLPWLAPKGGRQNERSLFRVSVVSPKENRRTPNTENRPVRRQRGPNRVGTGSQQGLQTLARTHSPWLRPVAAYLLDVCCLLVHLATRRRARSACGVEPTECL